MEKLISIIKSIVNLFLAQFKKNQSQNKYILSVFLLAIFLSKNIEKKVKKLYFNYKLKLLYLKIVQINKYGHVLNFKSNLY